MRWGLLFRWWLAAWVALLSGCTLPQSPVLVEPAPETTDAADAGDGDGESDAPMRDADADEFDENRRAAWEERSDCEPEAAHFDERDACDDGGVRDAAPDVAIDVAIDDSSDRRTDDSSADSSDGATEADGDAGDGSADGAPCVEAIAAGMWHMCVLTKRGTAHCWGYDVHGELGDGTTMSTARPMLSSVPA